jgi:hypothetical protein
MRLTAMIAAIGISIFLVPNIAEAKTKKNQFRDVTWNGAKPSYSNGVHSFAVMPGQCGSKKYGDGRGESDCGGGRVRSQIRTKQLAKVGQTKQYSLDFFVPNTFSYDGDRNYPSYSRLLISEWKRNEGIKNHIYEVLLDSVRGVTFERKVCVKPSEFGKWNTFSLKIKWARDGSGYMEASCNGRVILQRLNTQTVIPPDCGANYKLQCDPSKQKPNADIIWAIGPNFSGYGRDYRRLGKSSPFAPFPRRGISLQVKNIYYGRPK